MTKKSLLEKVYDGYKEDPPCKQCGSRIVDEDWIKTHSGEPYHILDFTCPVCGFKENMVDIDDRVSNWSHERWVNLFKTNELKCPFEDCGHVGIPEIDYSYYHRLYLKCVKCEGLWIMPRSS